jgi:dihydrofolate synthase/folylpolyglutamate synthase
LHTIRERVRLNGEPMSSAAFDESMRDVAAALDHVCDASRPTTAYEVMTTLALQRFAESRVDVAVLEVGLGGRLDSTNVVNAVVSALTPISLDHTQILGDTITAIAIE